MRILFLLCTLLLVGALPLDAQTLLKRDNNVPAGYDSSAVAGWEETMMLVPAGPARLDEIHIYWIGDSARADTLWIVGDPAEGSLSPTSWVWSYNALTEPIVVHYDGTPGWDTIDLRARNLHYDGYDRIVIQHRVQTDGPMFAVDGNGVAAPLSSFLYDAITVDQTFGFPGVYHAARGDFMVRALVTYDFPKGSGSASPPAATLVDVAKTAGITDAAGKALKSARVSVADWNGDGWDDIHIGQFFFQNNRNGTFTDVASTIGITASSSSWGDIDNDGDLDCYAVVGFDADRIYRNNGNGTFTDITEQTGITNAAPTITPIWLDFDHDGHLDLFIANGRTENAGQEEYFQDRLWHQEPNGTFRDITASSGIPQAEPEPYYDCWAASATDYDNDTWPDLFVANYRLAPDFLYRNIGNSTFQDLAPVVGVQGVPTADPSYFGHGAGTDWGDYDNDGDMDLFVGNLGHPDWRGQVSNPSLLFRNEGAPDYHFTEVHRQAGIKFFEMNFGAVWLDLDLDGYLDLWHCQYAYNAVGTNGEPKRLSRIYLNEGPAAGFHFKDVTWHTGALVHGAWTAARLDYDHDGDMDLIVASPTDAVKLFRNDVEKKGSSLSIRLVGSPTDLVVKDAYGSRVIVHAGGMMMTRVLSGGGGGTTATQNSNELNFGLGQATVADSVIVIFPNGLRRKFEGVRAGRSITIGYNGLILAESPFAGVAGRADASHGLRIEEADFDAGAFRLRVSAPDGSGSLAVDVADPLGRAVARGTIPPGSTGFATLDAPDGLADGAYFIRVTGKMGSVVGKVMVRR